MASQYRQQLNNWLREQHFDVDQVLDIGGGEKPAREMTDIKYQRYVIMDNVEDLKPDVIWDLNEFAHPDEIFSIYQDPRFNLVFCLNVFEYIWNPYNAIANLYNWTHEGGTLVVNFPFLYPIHNPVGIDYLRYTDEWIQKMFHQRFKFKSVEIFQMDATTGADSLISFYSQEGMHYRKNDDASWKRIGFIVKAVK